MGLKIDRAEKATIIVNQLKKYATELGIDASLLDNTVYRDKIIKYLNEQLKEEYASGIALLPNAILNSQLPPELQT